MNIQFVNNDGAGFSGTTAVSNGTSIGAFFASKFPTASPSAYKIRVNNEIVNEGHLLAEGDRVVISPVKVAGA